MSDAQNVIIEGGYESLAHVTTREQINEREI